jgi:transcriptional regulator with XRE-family HTH domain
MTLRELRIRNHMTQKSLAEASDATRHAVLRMEQHVYPTPLPNIIAALSEITGLSEVSLIRQYEKEVHYNRVTNGQVWDLINVDTGGIFDIDYGSLHPFRGWRIELAHMMGQPDSQIQFCMAFSIHPYVLSEYEAYKTGYPESIRIALHEAGLPSNITTIFEKDERFNRVM